MKMRKRERQGLAWIWGMVYITGALLFVLSRYIRAQTPIGEQHDPAEPVVRIIHVSVTYFLVMAVGFVIKSHVIPGLKARKKRGLYTGITLLSLVAVFLFTAVGVLYSDEGIFKTVVSNTHAFLGLSTPLFVFLHLRSRKSA